MKMSRTLLSLNNGFNNSFCSSVMFTLIFILIFTLTFILPACANAITVTQNPSSDLFVNPSGNLNYTQNIFFNWSVSEQVQGTCTSNCTLNGDNYTCVPCTPGIYGDSPCNSKCTVYPYPNSNSCTVSCASGENVSCNSCTPPTPEDNNCSATCINETNGDVLCIDICHVSPSACTGSCNLPPAATCNLSLDNEVKKTIPVTEGTPLFESYSPISECVLHPWNINCWDGFGQSQIFNSFTIYSATSATPTLINQNIEIEHQRGGTPITFNWSMEGGGCKGTNVSCSIIIPGANIVSEQTACTIGNLCSATVVLPDSFACNSDWYVSCIDTAGQNSSSAIGSINVLIPHCINIQTNQSQPICKISQNLNASGSDCISLNNINSPQLDCSGHLITGLGTGSGSSGISIRNSSKAVLKNCGVYLFENGIEILDSNSVSISDCEMASCSAGLYAKNADNIVLASTSFSDNTLAAIIKNSDNVVLDDVDIGDNENGVIFDHGDNITINKMDAKNTNSSYAINFTSVNVARVSGSEFWKNGNADEEEESNASSSGGGILIDSSNGVSIENNAFDSDTISINVIGSAFNTTISKNTITNSISGIVASDSSNSITIKTNNITKCTTGLMFDSGSSDVMFYNNILDNELNAVVDTESVSASLSEPDESQTNILGCGALGGNAWFSQGNGFSENCSNFDNNCFCDENYSIDEIVTDLFPLTINKGLEFSVLISSIAGKQAGSYEQYINKEYVAATPYIPALVVINLITSHDAEFFCNSSLGGNVTINTTLSTEGIINVTKPVGCYNITVKCAINITNASSQEHTFCIDDVPPAINFGIRQNISGIIINPNDNEILNKHSFRLNMSADDSLSTFVAMCIFELNDTNEIFLPETNADGRQYCVKKRTLQNGTYKYRMFAVDAAGNAASTGYRTVIVDAPPSNAGCSECENIGDYFKSGISSAIDETNKKIALILYMENLSGHRIAMPGAPVLVWVKNASYENLSKVVTNANGSAYFSYAPWNNSAMDYTFIYCCFYEDCGFDKCLIGAKVSANYIKKYGIYDVNSVPDASPNQPNINYSQIYVLPINEKLKINPKVDKNLLEGSEALCVPIFMLFGILLAALYYSGRNPLGFIDFSPLRMSSHIRYTPRGMQTGVKITTTTLRTLDSVRKMGKRGDDGKETKFSFKNIAKADKVTFTNIKDGIGMIKTIVKGHKKESSTDGKGPSTIQSWRIALFSDKSGKGQTTGGGAATGTSDQQPGVMSGDNIYRTTGGRQASGLIGVLALFGLMTGGMKGGVKGGALANFLEIANTQWDVMSADYQRRSKHKWLSYVPLFVLTYNTIKEMVGAAARDVLHVKESWKERSRKNASEQKLQTKEVLDATPPKGTTDKPPKEYVVELEKDQYKVQVINTEDKKSINVVFKDGKVVIDPEIVDAVVNRLKANDNRAYVAYQQELEAAKAAPKTKTVETIVQVSEKKYSSAPQTFEVAKVSYGGWKEHEVLEKGDKDSKDSHKIKELQMLLNWMIDNKIIEGKKISQNEMGTFGAKTEALVKAAQIAGEKFVDKNGMISGSNIKYDAPRDGKVGIEFMSMCKAITNETHTIEKTIKKEESISPPPIKEDTPRTFGETNFYGTKIEEKQDISIGDHKGVSQMRINAGIEKSIEKLPEWLKKRAMDMQSLYEQSTIGGTGGDVAKGFAGAVGESLEAFGLGIINDMIKHKMTPDQAQEKIDILLKRDNEGKTHLEKLMVAPNPDVHLKTILGGDGKPVFKSVGEFYQAVSITNEEYYKKTESCIAAMMGKLKDQSSQNETYNEIKKIYDLEKTDPNLYSVRKNEYENKYEYDEMGNIQRRSRNMFKDIRGLMPDKDETSKEFDAVYEKQKQLGHLEKSFNAYIANEMIYLDANYTIEKTKKELENLQASTNSDEFNKKVEEITKNAKRVVLIQDEDPILTEAKKEFITMRDSPPKSDKEHLQKLAMLKNPEVYLNYKQSSFVLSGVNQLREEMRNAADIFNKK
ncbi:MAG: NosD domain-containing protein [Candidatus Micrarchaeota archaeon]